MQGSGASAEGNRWAAGAVQLRASLVRRCAPPTCAPNDARRPPAPRVARPFLDLLEVDSGETRRIWQSSPPHYEYTSSILSDLDTSKPITLDNLRLLASRESVTEPPQFYIKAFTAGGAQHTERCLSRFPHPYPTLRDLQARGTGRCMCRGVVWKLDVWLGASVCWPATLRPPLLTLPAVLCSCGTAEGDHQVQAGRRPGAQRHPVPAARCVGGVVKGTECVRACQACGGRRASGLSLHRCPAVRCMQAMIPHAMARCPPCCTPTHGELAAAPCGAPSWWPGHLFSPPPWPPSLLPIS